MKPESKKPNALFGDGKFPRKAVEVEAGETGPETGRIMAALITNKPQPALG